MEKKEKVKKQIAGKLKGKVNENLRKTAGRKGKCGTKIGGNWKKKWGKK